MNVTLRTNTHNTSPRKVAIRYIAIHYTAGTTSKKGSARNTASWFANPKATASADYIVDDAEAVQYNPNPKTRYTWAVGDKLKTTKGGGKWYGKCTNRNSISVEICSSLKKGYVYAETPANSQGWYFTDEVIANAVELVKELMRIYNIPASNVIRHYDVSGKKCPGIVGWNEDSGDTSAWVQFKKAIAGEI